MSDTLPNEVREAAITAVRPYVKTLVGIGIPDVTPTDVQIGKAIDAALSALEAAGWEVNRKGTREALEHTLKAMADDWAGNPVHDRAEIMSRARKALLKATPEQSE